MRGAVGKKAYSVLQAKNICVLMLVLLSMVMTVTVADNAQAKNTVVTDLKAGRYEGYDRFVMELTAAPRYKLFTLDSPYRLVVDVAESDWAVATNDIPRVTRVPSIDKIRYGNYRPNESRVVLDLAYPVMVVREFVLPPRDGFPYRLVIDLAPVQKYVPLEPVQKAPVPVKSAPQPAVPSVSNSVVANSGVPVPVLRPAGAGRPSSAPAYKPIIIIDAGHGGVDPGASGVKKTREKDITLAYARELHDALKKSGRYRPVLTRGDDRFLKLRERVHRGRKHNGDLFISLHADSAQNSNARGLSVYTLSETASDKEAAYLAKQENKVDILADVDLSDEEKDVAEILIDLAQRDTNNKSSVFAEILVKELGRTTRLLPRPHRFAGFAVLKAPDIPSVLIEMGFLSNVEDEKLLKSGSYRERVVEGVVQSIDEFFEKYDPAP